MVERDLSQLAIAYIQHRRLTQEVTEAHYAMLLGLQER